ncbi:MAG: 2-amino-4-hydroxy-6-hydroxymethyldihydropteridine diphosphokinase [Actinomycetota bacterium]|nr:2-amino-4-hydroxy-6-hydroxymethyldihydropteridine diphosphokinase [Actinomycetota bacterium]
MAETAFIGLGSNLGDRLSSLQAALDLLGAEPGIEVVSSSRVWESDPVGGPVQPDFLNAVVRVETSLTPRDLLLVCHQVEAALGRVRDVRWGPRTVDVDLLLFGHETVDEMDLTLPHPRMTRRAFVLLPLLELDPDVCSPDGKRLVDVRLGPEAAAGARPFAPPLKVSRHA